MADATFFTRAPAQTLQQLASLCAGELADAADSDYIIEDVAPLDRASQHQISFLDNPKYVGTFARSNAAACVIKAKYRDQAPDGMRLIISEDPYRCYASIAQYFYPYQPMQADISEHAKIDDTAEIGKGCAIASGAVIGKHAIVGDGCMIGANAVIHDNVRIGNNSRIGALSTLSHCHIGAGVIIHRGVHIGQDGFGFAMGRGGHVKVPQLGRVIIQDNVEIGSGACIDRGTGPDTTIGQGSKIDNLVQIGHNVSIGEHCVVVAQCGIAGSSTIGDYAVLGGQVGVAGHLSIGAGARVAAQSGVTADIPAGATYGGYPAIPVKDWHRQSVTLSKLIKSKGRAHRTANNN